MADPGHAPAHPVARLVCDAARGRFPAPDGGWRRLPRWRTGLDAVIAFTAHAVFCGFDQVSDERLDALGANGYGGATNARLISAIAGPRGWIGSLDLLMVTTPDRRRRSAEARRHADGDTGSDGSALVPRPELVTHPRVTYARALREIVTVLGYADASRTAVATIGRGIGGLPEVSFELESTRRGEGDGRALVAAAVHHVGEAEVVVACAAPGNAASVRSLLATGFVPIGAVQLIRSQGNSEEDLGRSRA